jgi:hypothetical protein
VKWWSFGFSGTLRLRFAGVVDRPSHEHPASHVKERQAALFGSLAQEAHDGVNVVFTPIRPHLVHVSDAAFALAIPGNMNPKLSQQGMEFGAWAELLGRFCRRNSLGYR